jgi:hypothetical protein
MATPKGEGVTGLEVVAGIIAEHGHGQLDTVICRLQLLAMGSCDEGAENLAAVGFVVVSPHHDTAPSFRQRPATALAGFGRLQLDEGAVLVTLHFAHHPLQTAHGTNVAPELGLSCDRISAWPRTSLADSIYLRQRRFTSYRD